MSQLEAELGARIHSVRQLGTIVHALRGIAANHAQQSRRRLAAVRRYADTVAGAIAQALTLLPAEVRTPPSSQTAPMVLIVFCAEQGFAGVFSESVLDAADTSGGPVRLMLVGRRGLRVAAARGLEAEWWTPTIAQAASAASLAEHIALALYQRIDSGVQRAAMVFARPRAGSGVEIERRWLLPVDLGRFAPASRSLPPLVQLDPAQLLEKLAAEYVRAELAEAVLHSFAAENVARMAAMAAAGDNVTQMLESLTQQARIARQEAITAEVVELATGAAALPAVGERPA